MTTIVPMPKPPPARRMPPPPRLPPKPPRVPPNPPKPPPLPRTSRMLELCRRPRHFIVFSRSKLPAEKGATRRDVPTRLARSTDERLVAYHLLDRSARGLDSPET